MVGNQLQGLVPEPKIQRFGQALPISRGIVNFGNGNHAVRNAESHNVVQVTDTTAGVPDNADAVGTGFRNFGNGFAFPIGPDKHVVHPAKDDLLVVLAIKEPVLYEKSRFCRCLYHGLHSN